jgi:prepilin-type N-terminal cleavage/methylation domain-containing protein
MLTNRLLSRTARLSSSSRGGFTLVELLVVIGIIAILAGVALGPITNGLKKAKQSAGMQTVRTIALGEFTFSTDNGAYPDTNNPVGNKGTGAAAVVQPLMAGGYISDATVFYIKGGTATQYAGSAPATGIVAANISWDFAGNGGNGVNSNFPDQCPVAWSSLVGGTEPSLVAAAGAAMTAVPALGNPFGTDGIAVAYHSNSAKFLVSSTLTGTHVVTIVDATNPGGVPATAIVLQGGG